MRYVRTTDPAADVVSDAEIKAFLRIDHTDEDSIIGVINEAATWMAEQHCHRSFIDQVWKVYMQEWPKESLIRLRYGIGQSIDSIKYTVSTSLDTTLASSEYITGLQTDEILINPSDSWPETDNDFPNSIEITMTCGYGAAGSNVPKAIHSAILMLAADLYEVRQSHSDRMMNQVKINDRPLVQTILDPYVILI